MVNQEQLAAAGYILTFYRDLESLNDYVPSFKNLLVEFHARGINPAKLDADDANKLLSTVPQIRFLTIRIHTKISGLKTKIGVFETILNDPEYQALYSEINNNPTPSFETVMRYCIIVNAAFVKGVADEFLTKAENAYSTYMGGTTTNYAKPE